MTNIKTKITKLHYTRNPQGALFEILKFCSYFYELGAHFKNFLCAGMSAPCPHTARSGSDRRKAAGRGGSPRSANAGAWRQWVF